MHYIKDSTTVKHALSKSCVLHHSALQSDIPKSSFNVDTSETTVPDPTITHGQLGTRINGPHSVYRVFNAHVIEDWKKSYAPYCFVRLGDVNVFEDRVIFWACKLDTHPKNEFYQTFAF